MMAAVAGGDGEEKKESAMMNHKTSDSGITLIFSERYFFGLC